MADPPIACTLTPDALTARREGLLTELVGLALRRELVSDGLRLTFDPTTQPLSTIARRPSPPAASGGPDELRLVPSSICRIFNRRNCQILARR